MNAKRLAFLRKLSETYTKTDRGESVATNEDMLDLIADREVLINALRGHGVHLKPCFGRCECGLDDAFRKVGEVP